nr:uncharacterized protein LOC105339866 [Crassostrea gigas]XP_034322248.1 uncharacterized protein LOC105341927 isoform X3 [Crassostrea gigas]
MRMEITWRALFLQMSLYLAIAYENIALNKEAWERFPWKNIILGWGAQRAVDGRKSNLSASGGECTISAERKATAEWRVDLGEILNIYRIFIQHRTDELPWDAKNDHASRFLGFSVIVSNTTEKNDGVLCFKDKNFTLETIPNSINITCPIFARYVIFYNNRTNRPFPAGYSEYAYNELCELEVFGCSKFGYYGENCSIPWYEHCQLGLSDIKSGTRQSNIEGIEGQQCNKTHLLEIPLGDPDDLSSILYSFAPLFATLFVISFVINIIFTIRECRNKLRLKNQNKSKARNQQRVTPDIDIHEKVDANTEYQELTEVKTTDNSIYDEIKL